MLIQDNEKPLVTPQVVTKTFHGAGIVVPVDKNDVGYRELPETDGEPKNTLNLGDPEGAMAAFVFNYPIPNYSPDFV